MAHPSDGSSSRIEAVGLLEAGRSLEETLSGIVEAVRVSVAGVDHVGITTRDRSGHLQTRAATDPVVRKLDDLQYDLGEGPGLDALSTERVVAVPHLPNEERWPRYVSAAVAATGLTAQLAVQLPLGEGGDVGSLNLYSTGRGDLDPEAVEIAQLFAAHAAIAVHAATQVSQLTTALESRTVIGQATGIVMERYQMNDQRAFAFLTRASSHGNIKLRAAAQELVDRANNR